MYPQSLIVLQRPAWRGIPSISLMEHNYAGSDTDGLATHNRRYLGRGNLTSNQSNQQLSTLYTQHYGANYPERMVLGGYCNLPMKIKIKEKPSKIILLIKWDSNLVGVLKFVGKKVSFSWSINQKGSLSTYTSKSFKVSSLTV